MKLICIRRFRPRRARVGLDLTHHYRKTLEDARAVVRFAQRVSDDDELLQVVGQLERVLEPEAGDGEHPNGVIAEDDARAAWIEAIDELRSRGETDAADRGRAIAIALGWLDDEQEQEQ